VIAEPKERRLGPVPENVLQQILMLALWPMPEIDAVQVQQIKGHNGNSGAQAFLQLNLEGVKFTDTAIVLDDGLSIDDGIHNPGLSEFPDDEAEPARPLRVSRVSFGGAIRA
jgi:hypothetical protein